MYLSASIVAAAAVALPWQQGPSKGIGQIPADKEPVVTTPSGLKYCVLTKGPEGASPKFGDRVTVQYTGWHMDGSVFDSSRNRPKPVEFVLGDVIEAWDEALMMMTPGAHWKLTVPPQVGYGERGNPPIIKPNETLLFELELLAFQKGVDLPPFHAGDPAKQKKSESGLVYEPIRESGGAAPRPDDALELKFALWTTKGRLVDCSEKRDNYAFRGRAADLPFRILQIAPQFMTVGSRWRFEVPPDLVKNFPGFGATFLPVGSTTVWELELVSAKEVKLPPFVKPDPDHQKTTASGLKYEILAEGSGAQAKNGDPITVRYTGWLTDGTVFDSSLLHGDTYSLQLPGRVIAGWNEGLLLMKEGATFRFEIPAELGYKAAGKGKIPGNATLIFQIEMVKVGK